MQKENSFFFSFPSVSSFGGARVTLQGARGAPSGHVLATEKHSPSSPLGRMNPTERGMKKNAKRNQFSCQQNIVFLAFLSATDNTD